MTRPAASLDLSLSPEHGILQIGDVKLVVLPGTVQLSCISEVAGSIFDRLVEMDRELADLRAWRLRTEEWSARKSTAGEP